MEKLTAAQLRVLRAVSASETLEGADFRVFNTLKRGRMVKWGEPSEKGARARLVTEYGKEVLAAAEQEQASVVKSTETRFVGHCQICEGQYKLTADFNMVHHGYTRPGIGHIIGDCMAVGYPAYEQSCEQLKLYVTRLKATLVHLEGYLAALRGGEVKKLNKTNRRYIGHGHYEETTVELCEGDDEFPRQLKIAISNQESEISQYQFEISRGEKRIAAWVELPVRTIEEAAAEEEAVKDARRAEKTAARQAREDKKAALETKRQELEARRQAIIAGFRAQFVALASAPETADRRLAAIDLARKTTLKKYDFFWAQDLGCNEELVTLGLATTSVHNGRTFYDYSFYFRRG